LKNKKNDERSKLALLQFEEDRKNWKERAEIVPTKASIATPFRERQERARRGPGQMMPGQNPEDDPGDEDDPEDNPNNNVQNNLGPGHVLNPGDV